MPMVAHYHDATIAVLVPVDKVHNATCLLLVEIISYTMYCVLVTFRSLWQFVSRVDGVLLCMRNNIVCCMLQSR